jgi:chromosome segregation ATPase
VPDEDHNENDMLLLIMGKIDKLTESVNEYKTSTSIVQSQHSEKIAQLEEKVNQIQGQREGDIESLRAMSKQISDNRHAIANQQQVITALRETTDTTKHDINNGFAKVNDALTSQKEAFDARVNQEKGRQQRDNFMKWALPIFVSIIVAFLTLIGTYVIGLLLKG